MATRLYGISVGEGEFGITEGAGSAVAADQIELTVELATTAVATNLGGSATTRAVSKAEVLDALEKIKNHIMKSNWPPA